MYLLLTLYFFNVHTGVLASGRKNREKVTVYEDDIKEGRNTKKD